MMDYQLNEMSLKLDRLNSAVYWQGNKIRTCCYVGNYVQGDPENYRRELPGIPYLYMNQYFNESATVRITFKKFRWG